MDFDIGSRRARYSALSTRLALMDDDELRAAVGPIQMGFWGTHNTIEIDGHKVFVKRVPVTDLELEHAWSTRNLYGLPIYYQYGVGSAGFGVFREVVTHIKTTNWVLEQACESFPLMYHHRIVERREPGTPLGGERLEAYVREWNGSEAIGRYASDRSTARHVTLLFLEHFPTNAWEVVWTKPGTLPGITSQLLDTVTFLRAHDLAHMDAHWNNVVSDGERMYLTDFGLALDDQFHLDDTERAFLRSHEFYDYGEVLLGIGAHILNVSPTLSDHQRDAYGLTGAANEVDLTHRLMDHVDDMLRDGVYTIDASYVATAHRYRDIVLYMLEFLGTMRPNHRKDTPYDDAHLRKLLDAAGVPR